jgi:hypothetical protein
LTTATEVTSTIAYVLVCPAAAIALLVPPTYEAVAVLATSQGAVNASTAATSIAIMAAGSFASWLGVTLSVLFRRSRHGRLRVLSVWLRWGSILSGVGVAVVVVGFLFLTVGSVLDGKSGLIPSALPLHALQAALDQGARMLFLLVPTPRRWRTRKGIVVSAGVVAGAAWILVGALQPMAVVVAA